MSVCVGVCFSNSLELPSFFSKVQSRLCCTNPKLSKPVKQKIIRLCSFINLGWTCKLHICWFIIVDVPVAGAHHVEDHINGLTHLFFMLASDWGFGKRSLKRTPGTETGIPAVKKVDFYGSNRGGTISVVCVCVAVWWRRDWNLGGFGNKRTSRLWSRHRSSDPRRFVFKIIFLSTQTLSVGGQAEHPKRPTSKIPTKNFMVLFVIYKTMCVFSIVKLQ